MAFCEFTHIHLNTYVIRWHFVNMLPFFKISYLTLILLDKFISFERGKSFNIMKITIQPKNAYLSDKLNICTHI